MSASLRGLAPLFVFFAILPSQVVAQQCVPPSVKASGPDADIGGGEPREMALGEFHHDGFLDLAVVNVGSGEVAILRGQGSSFVLEQNLFFGSAADVVVADFNHDGWDDVAVSVPLDNEVDVQLSDGNGGFELSVSEFLVGTTPTALTSGDYDGDGDIDLAVFNSVPGSISILRGDGNGGFTPLAPFAFPAAAELRAADLNGDGWLDLVSVDDVGNRIHAALGDGTLDNWVVVSSNAIGPEGLVIGDFNRDGVLDAVTVNNGSGELEFLRGDGGGGFLSVTTQSIGAGTFTRVAAGDLDGDGDLDVAIPDKSNFQVFISLNDGQGNFDIPVSFITSGLGYDAAIADFDRDGRSDVAVSLPLANRVQLFLNDFGIPCPNPSFERLGKSFAANGFPVAIAAADFNEDGSPDFATANQGSPSYTHWVGLGNGSFDFPSSTPLGPNPVSNTVADIDFDSDLDLITAFDGKLQVDWNGGGSLAFGFSINLLPGNPYFVAAGDVSGDGKVDLVVSLVSSDVLVFRNDGSGGFLTGDSYIVGANPRGVVIGDFNNDGLPDLAVAEAGNQIVFFRNVGGGAFTPQGFRMLSASPTALRAAHLDGGANLDLVVTVGFGGAGAKLQTLLGDGAFGFTMKTETPTGDTTATRHGLEVGDFNQDGLTDVAVALSPMPRVRLFFGNGSGEFLGTKSEVTPEAPGALAATDLDRDGILDLLVTQPSTSSVLALPGTGAGRFSPEFYTPPSLPSAGSRGVAHGDFNGDGVLDLVIANFNNDSVTRFLGQGNGTFDAGVNFSIAPARNPNWVTVEDFNHDGNLDILASAAGGTGDLAVLPGNGFGGFGTAVTSFFGSAPFMSRAADFNLDGKLDVAVLTGNVIRIMRGTGDGGFTSQNDQPLGGTGTGLWVGDFNRDGLVDLAGTETSGDRLVRFTATALGEWSSSSAPIGNDPGDFDAGDFNGDGYVDFAIPLEREGKVRIVLSNGAGGFNFPGFDLVTATDPVALRVLDWNRDGALDLVVAGKGDHMLWFHKGEGAGGFSSFPPGTAGVRIPTYLTVADFNSDGRTDIAVVPDTSTPVSPPGVGVVLNTNCRSRQLKLDTDVSTCDNPGSPFFPFPAFRFQDDGENFIQCENRAITASIVPGTGSPGASTVGTATEAPNSGIVQFGNLGVDQGGARFRMQFTHAEARRKLSRFFSRALAPTISGPLALCEGTPAVYFADLGYELYDWRLDSSPVSMAPSVDFTGALSPGPRHIDLQVEADTCLGSSFVDVNVTGALSGVDVNPAGPITLCPTCTGPVATATAIDGGPPSFQWGYRLTPGDVIFPLSGKTSSSYTIEAEDFGTGTVYLVATVTPTCGAVGVSNEVQIDVTTAGGLEPLKAFTARSTKGQNFLELATPATGPCDGIRILRNETAFPSDPHATGANFWVGGADIPCPAPGKTFVIDAGLADDQKYFYSAWVKDASGNFSARDEVAGRPFDHTLGKVKWAYSTGYTAMAQAGLRIQGPTSSVYVVSNDSLVHGLEGGPAGGFWLANAVPARLGLPSQARPPVVSFAVGGAPNGAAFVTSQDGKLYALDADTLAEIWPPAAVGEMVTGPAAALFGASRLLFSGSRNSLGNPNELLIFNADSGLEEGSFDNGGTIGPILGGISVDRVGARAFFGSQAAGGTGDTFWAVDISDPGSPTLDWSKNIGEVSGSPVFFPGGVVAGTENSTVELRDPANGNSVWGSAYNAGDGPVKGFVFPYLYSGTWNFLFATNSKVTSIRNGLDPILNWETTAILSPSTPVWLPGTTSALVGGGDGKLYLLTGIHTATPTPLDLPLPGAAPAVGVPAFDVPNKMIYVGTDEGVIYAVEYPFP